MNIEQQNISEPIPIVFVHTGDSWYLPYVLRQALSVNNDSHVTLICDDKASINISGVEVLLIDDLHNPMVDEFYKNYKHMQTTNDKDLQVLCWLRWFYMLRYMELKNIRQAFYLDSDVLMYSSPEKILSLYPEISNGCGFLIPQQLHSSYIWSASGHFSYWTKDTLREFCNFTIDTFCKKHLLDSYNQKWNWHLENKVDGGICDMTTLYLFSHEFNSCVTNLLTENCEDTFDVNFNFSVNFLEDEYETQNGHKRLVFEQGKPVIFRDKIMVSLHNIHLQGAAKRFIPNYYRGLPFNEKFKHFLERLKHTKLVPLRAKLIALFKNNNI